MRIGLLAVIDGNQLTGPARQLLATSSDLVPLGVDTRLALFERRSGANPITRSASSQGICIERIPDRFPGDPRTAVALGSLLRRDVTQVLQTHGYKANVLGRLLARRLRRPWIAFLHGETWENLKVRAYCAIERLVVRGADRVVAVSQTMAARLTASGIPADKVRVVRNACLDAFATEPAAAAVAAGPVIGVVARLSPEKGVDVALEVHSRIVRRFPGARLLIAGDGPQAGALRAQTERLGIADSVTYLGHREDMAEIYRSMTVLLMPSRSEGLPNVALEAMARGVPVVATSVGGVPEVVVHGRTGLLAPADDAPALAERLATVLANGEQRRRLAEGALAHVRAEFSRETKAAALAAIYREVLA